MSRAVVGLNWLWFYLLHVFLSVYLFAQFDISIQVQQFYICTN